MSRRLLVPLGVVVLVDVIRVWLPTIITVFGQAASTPAELMGAFALVWFVLGFAALPLARWSLFPVVAGSVLAVCRLASLFVGGQVLLYVASFGLLAGLFWLVTLMMRAPAPRLVAVGLAASAVTFLWRGPGGLVLAVATAAGFVVLLFKQGDARDGGSGTGVLLIGPVAFLALQIGLSRSMATTGVSYVDGGSRDGSVAVSGGIFATAATVLLFSVSVLAFLWFVFRPPVLAWARVLSAVLLVAGAVAFTVGPGWLYVAVVPVTAAALGACAGVAFAGSSDTPVLRRGAATAAGMLIFALAAFAYYAAYDLGYPNAWVPPLIALLVAVPAIRSTPVPVPAPIRPASFGVASVVVLALVSGGAWWAHPGVAAAGGPAELRVVAYNIRMAFGLDGRFSADRLATVIRAEHPDVVLLSEVDRGWLLNGGHDDVQVLARELGMRYIFAPAADNVWGDAILTNLRVESLHTERMPSYGAPTGAQVLGAVLRRGPGTVAGLSPREATGAGLSPREATGAGLSPREATVAVVSTHLQPPPGRPPLEQARDVARFAERLKAPGRPVIIGGDFNTRPGDEPFEVLLAAGYSDALAARRPVLPRPADAPRQQIDHVFIAGGQARDVSAPRSTASDHLAVAVTISW